MFKVLVSITDLRRSFILFINWPKAELSAGSESQQEFAINVEVNCILLKPYSSDFVSQGMPQMSREQLAYMPIWLQKSQHTAVLSGDVLPEWKMDNMGIN